MRIGLLGRKVGMTQIFDEKGNVVPVTVIDTSGCFISQVKTRANDGYNALQLAQGDRKPQNVNKARVGHFKKAGIAARANLKELRMQSGDDLTQLKAGQPLGASLFQKGDKVDVIAVSKGKGFAGVMKRYNYKGKDATHGTSKYYRHGGSNGSNTFPGRVLKNKGMPGHMGDANTTVPNLLVVDVKLDDNLLLLRGAVPGGKNTTIEIRLSKRALSKMKDRTFAPAAAAEAPAEA